MSLCPLALAPPSWLCPPPSWRCLTSPPCPGTAPCLRGQSEPVPLHVFFLGHGTGGFILKERTWKVQMWPPPMSCCPPLSVPPSAEARRGTPISARQPRAPSKLWALFLRAGRGAQALGSPCPGAQLGCFQVQRGGWRAAPSITSSGPVSWAPAGPPGRL